MLYRNLLIFTFVTNIYSLSLPPTNGPYSVGSKPLLLEKTTQDDPVSPNGTGTSLILNVYYPTLANVSLRPYLWEGLATYYEEYYSVPSGAFRDVTARVAHAAPPLLDCAELALPTLIWGAPFAGPPSQMFFNLFSQLVSTGYTIVTIDHPGEQPYLQYPNGTGIPGLSEDFIPDDKFINRVHEYRLEDNSAVLDALTNIQETLDIPLNLTHVALFGHSLGGSAALNQLLIERNRSHPEILGSVDIDGQIFPPASATDSSADIRTPAFLLISEQHLAIGDPTFPTFVSWQSQWVKEISVHGKTNHTDFSDLVMLLQANGITGGDGAIKAERMVNVTRTFVGAFFDMISGKVVGESVLSGSEEVRQDWPEVGFENSVLD
ncbi:hypothetical protein N0V90_004981 [Kalmusia sp. IMI 367209]|nr:hypothetical protein N0V90_004981 [Kalmusia sp. IMI 367209]